MDVIRLVPGTHTLTPEVRLERSLHDNRHRRPAVRRGRGLHEVTRSRTRSPVVRPARTGVSHNRTNQAEIPWRPHATTTASPTRPKGSAR
jgi:hypothetical protein